MIYQSTVAKYSSQDQEICRTIKDGFVNMPQEVLEIMKGVMGKENVVPEVTYNINKLAIKGKCGLIPGKILNKLAIPFYKYYYKKISFPIFVLSINEFTSFHYFFNHFKIICVQLPEKTF